LFPGFTDTPSDQLRLFVRQNLAQQGAVPIADEKVKDGDVSSSDEL
jgi:hypothetical protein